MPQDNLEITLTNPVFNKYEVSLRFSQQRTAKSRIQLLRPGRGIFMLPFSQPMPTAHKPNLHFMVTD
jgi:hypothetical protein